MEYKRIIAVTGLPGLYELVTSKNDGAVVRNLEDGTTKFAASRTHNFSHLESIEVYTHSSNVNLVEVFQAMQASEEALPSDKDAAAVNTYFGKVMPDMDETRVYVSDKKKMVKWFGILKNAGVEMKISSNEEEAPSDLSATAEGNVEDQHEEALQENPTAAVNSETDTAVPSPS